MKAYGTLDGFPVVILYKSNGFDFFDIQIKMSEVVFDWDQLSTLQHIQILQQLEQNLPMAEENYN